MRYSLTEDTRLVGTLFSGRTVKIKLIDLVTDTLIPVSNDVCNESRHLPGVYIWSTQYLNKDTLTIPSTLLYEMTSLEDNRKCYGKIVIGGYLDKISDIDVVVAKTIEISDTVDIIFARQ